MNKWEIIGMIVMIGYGLLMLIGIPFIMYWTTNLHNKNVKEKGKCPGCLMCYTGYEHYL